MTEWIVIGISVGLPVLTMAAAWGGAKASMNGLRNEVREMKNQCVLRGERMQQMGERVARIEAWKE